MEPDRCSRCRRAAVARQPYSGRALCREHLVRDVEARAKRAIRRQGGLRHGDRIGLFAPAGPHGDALAAFASRLLVARRDLSLVALVSGDRPPEPLWEIPAVAVREASASDEGARLHCTLLLLPTTLEERAADVLGSVVAGCSASLLADANGAPVRAVRPFENVPGAEVRLYLSAVAGAPPSPDPPGPADPFEHFIADELERHARSHPSAPFALVRVAEALAGLSDEESGRC